MEDDKMFILQTYNTFFETNLVYVNGNLSKSLRQKYSIVKRNLEIKRIVRTF